MNYFIVITLFVLSSLSNKTFLLVILHSLHLLLTDPMEVGSSLLK